MHSHFSLDDGLLKYLSCFSLFKFIFYRTMGKGKCLFKLKKIEAGKFAR